MTMQGWVTRNRLREEQEQAKIEQARKEGFADGYLAAARQQASQPVKMVKVREFLDTPSAHRTHGGLLAALAELDAAEGKGEGRR